VSDTDAETLAAQQRLNPDLALKSSPKRIHIVTYGEVRLFLLRTMLSTLRDFDGIVIIDAYYDAGDGGSHARVDLAVDGPAQSQIFPSRARLKGGSLRGISARSAFQHSRKSHIC